MARANAIARCRATLADGTTLEYRDWEPAHIRQGNFQRIMEASPLSFSAETTDGAVFTVVLADGSFVIDGQRIETEPQPTPLRLIYYKHMIGTTGMGNGSPTFEPRCEYFVVGWQTTTYEGRNLKIGVKVWPEEFRWEVTEDI